MGRPFYRKDRPSVSNTNYSDRNVWANWSSMHEFNQSLRYDKRMYNADITGSIAYSKGLAKIGILTEMEVTQIIDGLVGECSTIAR